MMMANDEQEQLMMMKTENNQNHHVYMLINSKAFALALVVNYKHVLFLFNDMV